MYDSYIMRRTQIYLEEDQGACLDRRASELGTTRSELIREAIGAYLDGESDRVPALARFRKAVAETAGSGSRLRAGPDYVEELRAADMTRLEKLDRRRG